MRPPPGARDLSADGQRFESRNAVVYRAAVQTGNREESLGLKFAWWFRNISFAAAVKFQVYAQSVAQFLNISGRVPTARYP